MFDTRLEPSLPVSDLSRAKQWYLEKLDLKPVREDEMAGGAFYETGGGQFLLYQSEFAGTNQATAAGWQVEDVPAKVAELRSRGVVFEEYDFGDEFKTKDGILALPDGRLGAWFKDSEGNILSLFQDN